MTSAAVLQRGEERLATYCAQRNVAYVSGTRGEERERRAERRAFLTAKLTPRQQRRLRRKGWGWA